MSVLRFIGCIIECIEWREVKKVEQYYLTVEAVTKPMQVRADSPPYGGNRP